MNIPDYLLEQLGHIENNFIVGQNVSLGDYDFHVKSIDTGKCSICGLRKDELAIADVRHRSPCRYEKNNIDVTLTVLRRNVTLPSKESLDKALIAAMKENERLLCEIGILNDKIEAYKRKIFTLANQALGMDEYNRMLKKELTSEN